MGWEYGFFSSIFYCVILLFYWLYHISGIDEILERFKNIVFSGLDPAIEWGILPEEKPFMYMWEKYNFRKCFESILMAFSKLEINIPHEDLTELITEL